MRLYGRNLGTVDAQELNIEEMLEKYFPNNLEARKALLWLENKRIELIERLNNTPISPLNISNNMVNIEAGTIIHNGSNYIDSLIGISQLGLMPTEWFGVLESENEGRFCAFTKRVLSEEESVGFVANENMRSFNLSDNMLTFIYDTNNPIMQELLRLDYFEYEKIKQTNPERLLEIYSNEEIFMFDNLIEPMSKAGKRFHMNPRMPFYYWQAIPGGIPSKLINGICINENVAKNIEYIEQVQQLFPQVTIFDNKMNVIKMPIYTEENVNKSL